MEDGVGNVLPIADIIGTFEEVETEVLSAYMGATVNIVSVVAN